VPEFVVADQTQAEESCEEAGGASRKKSHEESRKRAREEGEAKVSDSSRRASTLAELAALTENVERCRERIAALAESQRLAMANPEQADEDDGLLMAIYEAERGLTNAVRLLQRATRGR